MALEYKIRWKFKCSLNHSLMVYLVDQRCSKHGSRPKCLSLRFYEWVADTSTAISTLVMFDLWLGIDFLIFLFSLFLRNNNFLRLRFKKKVFARNFHYPSFGVTLQTNIQYLARSQKSPMRGCYGGLGAWPPAARHLGVRGQSPQLAEASGGLGAPLQPRMQGSLVEELPASKNFVFFCQK